jgi:hypothetical protein
LTSRPGKIAAEVKVDLPRPRDLDAKEYIELRDEIFHTMGMSLQVGSQSVSEPSKSGRWLDLRQFGAPEV